MSVNPQYGVWVPVQRVGAHAVDAGAVRRAQRLGQRGPRRTASARRRRARPAAERAARRPHVTVVGLGPAGTDLVGPRRRRHCWPRTGARLPAHGPPPGGGRLSRAPARSTTSTSRPATFDEVYAGHRRGTGGGGGRGGARSRSSTPCPGRRWWPSARVDLLRADDRVEVTARPGPLLPGPGLGRARHRPAGRGRAPGRRRRLRRRRGRREGGPFLVAQCWSRHLLSEVKLARPGRRRPRRCRGRCSCTISASRTRWWRRSTGGSSTGPWSPTTSPRSTSRRSVPTDGRSAGDGGGPARRAHGHAARALPVGPGPDARVADAPPRRGVLRGPRRAGRRSTERRGRRGGATRTSRRSWATCSSRSSSTPAWPTRTGSSTWPTWRAACTTSWCTGTRTCSATSTPTTRTRSSRTGRRSRRARRAGSSVTEGIPAALPALMLTTKLARKARSVGLEPRRRERRARRRRRWPR